MEVEEGMGRGKGVHGDGKKIKKMKKVKHANTNNAMHGLNRKVIVENGAGGGEPPLNTAPPPAIPTMTGPPMAWILLPESWKGTDAPSPSFVTRSFKKGLFTQMARITQTDISGLAGPASSLQDLYSAAVPAPTIPLRPAFFAPPTER